MNSALILEKMEIKDNTFARQFETLVDGFTDEEFINDLLKNIMEIAYERKLKVVPILPKIALFFRKNTTYRDLLPPGIKI